jgi:hypothetical protein
VFRQGGRDLGVEMIGRPQPGAQALLEGKDEAKPEAEELVAQAVAGVPRGS